MRNPDDAFTDYNDEQRAHERMKAWMENHGWSTSIGRDPAFICMLIEELADELDNDNLNNS